MPKGTNIICVRATITKIVSPQKRPGEGGSQGGPRGIQGGLDPREFHGFMDSMDSMDFFCIAIILMIIIIISIIIINRGKTHPHPRLQRFKVDLKIDSFLLGSAAVANEANNRTHCT